MVLVDSRNNDPVDLRAAATDSFKEDRRMDQMDSSRVGRRMDKMDSSREGRRMDRMVNKVILLDVLVEISNAHRTLMPRQTKGHSSHRTLTNNNSALDLLPDNGHPRVTEMAIEGVHNSSSMDHRVLLRARMDRRRPPLHLTAHPTRVLDLLLLLLVTMPRARDQMEATLMVQASRTEILMHPDKGLARHLPRTVHLARQARPATLIKDQTAVSQQVALILLLVKDSMEVLLRYLLVATMPRVRVDQAMETSPRLTTEMEALELLLPHSHQRQAMAFQIQTPLMVQIVSPMAAN